MLGTSEDCFVRCLLHVNCHSTRCAPAVNAVCKDVHIFGADNVLLNHIIVKYI
jgi:hypothetical protein